MFSRYYDDKEFTRAILHLNSPGVARVRAGTTSLGEASLGDAASSGPEKVADASFLDLPTKDGTGRSPTRRTKKTLKSPQGGYFYGMPGRVLGGRPDERQSKNARIAFNNEHRSRIREGPDSMHENVAGSEQIRKTAEMEDPGSLDAAEMVPPSERDASEKRHAWARRAGVGRTPPANHFASVAREGPEPSTPTNTTKGTVARRMRRRTGDNDGSYGVKKSMSRRGHGRALSGDTTPTRAPSDRDKGSKYQDDAVARAFARYAADRERERDKLSRHRIETRSLSPARRAFRSPLPSSPRGSCRQHHDDFPSSPSSPDTIAAIGTAIVQSGRQPGRRREREDLMSRSSRWQQQQQQRQRASSADNDKKRLGFSLNAGDEDTADGLHDRGPKGDRYTSSLPPHYRRRIDHGSIGRNPEKTRQNDVQLALSQERARRSRKRRVLDPGNTNSGDESGRRTHRLTLSAADEDPIGSDLRGRRGRERYKGIYRDGRSEGESGSENGWGSEGSSMSGSDDQNVLRRAFDMYDLNGDGFITYLEVRRVSTSNSLWMVVL